MKIISYNVNGIRAAMRKGLIDWLFSEKPDVVCLQEIKAMKEQIDVKEFEKIGYKYNYWFSAEKKGYSGVAILSLHKPVNVEFGTDINYMDLEGRNIRIDFRDLSVIAWDFNICHKAIDIHDQIRNKNVSGFLPVEREWLQKFIDSGFTDSFRVFNNQPHKYSWWTYRANARANNKGWRIDYIMVSNKMLELLESSSILSEVRHSDHCPISINLSKKTLSKNLDRVI